MKLREELPNFKGFFLNQKCHNDMLVITLVGFCAMCICTRCIGYAVSFYCMSYYVILMYNVIILVNVL